MQLSELANRLQEFVNFLKPFNNSSVSINSFKVLQKNETKFISGCLYIGVISDLPLEPPCTNSAFICVQDTDFAEIYGNNTDINLCIVKSGISQFKIFIQISEIMNEEIRLALYLQKLIEVVYTNRGLQQLIDTAREILDHPMVLHDTSFKVLAFSYDAEKIIKFDEDINGDKYIASETINFIRNNSILAETRKHGSSQYVKKADTRNGTIAGLINIEGVEVATLAVYEAGQEFQPIDFKLIDHLSRLLSVELQKTNLFNIDKSLIPNYILADLFERKYNDEDTVNKRFHYLKWTKSSSLRIMIISNRMNDSFDSKIPFIIQTLHTFIPINNCIVYKSSLVVFIDDTLAKTLLNSENPSFIEYLGANSLFAGVSLSFTKLSESRKYYLQAQEASEIGQRYNLQLSRYEKCTNYIIADLISNNYDIIDFCHPAVIQLLNEDNANNTDFLQTLKYYLYFTKEPVKAAETLCIHRNTLFYRVNKIKQLTGITLDNVEEILQIYVSIKLLEINKKA